MQINRFEHTQLVILLIFIAIESVRHAQCHAISESRGPTTSQDLDKEHKENEETPNFRWLNAKTATSSETQLDLPPLLRPLKTSEIIDRAFDSHDPSTSTLTTLEQANSINPKPKAELNQQQSTRSSWIANFISNAEKISTDEQQLRDRNLNLLTSRPSGTESKAHDQALLENATVPADISSQAPTDSEEDPLELPTIDANQSQQVARSAINNETINSGDSGDHPKLPESNNVIAVLHTIGDVDENNVVVTMSTKQVLSCEQAYHRCSSREVCARALSVYDFECRGLISNRTDKCSPRCLQAMIALWSSEVGDDLVSCDCEGNEYCLQNKNRSSICKPEVQMAIKPDSVVSCSIASAICQADQLCSAALAYYYDFCQSLFSRGHCSMRCNNSLAILYRQPKATKLIDCQCDGSEDFPCVKYKTYTERFCLNKYDSRNSMVEFEEEESDLTNVAIENDRLINGDEDSFEEGDNEQPISDDNWIHLVSGRYFTNVQQRRQRTRPEQQQQSYINQQRALKQTQHQQQRRDRNNAKHRARSYENSSRGHVFALTASSAALSHLYHNHLVLLGSSLVTWILVRSGPR